MSASCDCTMTRQGVTTSMYTVIGKQRHRQMGRLAPLPATRPSPLLACNTAFLDGYRQAAAQANGTLGSSAPNARRIGKRYLWECMYLRVFMYVFTFDGFSNPNCMDVRRTVLGIPDVFARPSFGRRLTAEVAMKGTRSIGR